MAEEMNQEERIEAATENQAAETLHAADASAGIAENASEAAASKADSATQNNRAEEPEATGELSELDQALLEVAELKEQLARRNADVYNVQQEYANYVKRTKLEAQSHKESGIQKVIEVLLGVLDNAALAREHGELTGPAGKVVEELENTLRTNFMLERFGAVGDEFDPQIHEALMHQTSPDAEKEEISVLIQAGYKQGEKYCAQRELG
ncbi:nucleotide exchange factor GrpE [Arcanobacterium hippocoleae]|uniref:nucleotide exchange factor GrpE n=1 Tax=Arcanobacterium hippocoleae TaxID=149017 RepID=UPI00334219F9